MDVCDDLDGSYGYEFSDTVEVVCMFSTLNGNCTSYVKNHERCGGNRPEDSQLECLIFCHCTSGAWSDDTQDLCDECSNVCEDLRQICLDRCNNDEPCADDCVAEIEDGYCDW
jgi:hypothetical protein